MEEFNQSEFFASITHFLQEGEMQQTAPRLRGDEQVVAAPQAGNDPGCTASTVCCLSVL